MLKTRYINILLNIERRMKGQPSLLLKQYVYVQLSVQFNDGKLFKTINVMWHG